MRTPDSADERQREPRGLTTSDRWTVRSLRKWAILAVPKEPHPNNILYHEWFPQLFMDMHHMGNSDARLFLSPLYEPRHHSLDPLLTREIELTGAYLRTLLEEQGKIAVTHYVIWNHWRMSAIHTASLWHNVPTILFEAAGTRMATPIFQSAEELGRDLGQGLGKQGNNQTINYPSPWPGGWWRLRDIVEYAYSSAIGFLEASAKHKDRYLMNMYRMARNSIEKGKSDAPFAYVIRVRLFWNGGFGMSHNGKGSSYLTRLRWRPLTGTTLPSA